jgi:glycerate dehydrogenase
MFDHAVFKLMKPDAILINTARGGIVNETDLIEALTTGEIGGAGIDVLGAEPPAVDHPLLSADIPNLIVTPHNAWASIRARQACIDQLATVVKSFVRGQPVNRIV